jgi:hypothetical protein
MSRFRDERSVSGQCDRGRIIAACSQPVDFTRGRHYRGPTANFVAEETN